MTTTRTWLSTPATPTRLFIASLATLAAASSAAAVNKSWNTGQATWNWAPNWSPLGVPAVGDFVSIGNLAAAENDWVDLNVNSTIAGLTITDGMTLDTNSSVLVVQGVTTISGENHVDIFVYSSTLLVDQGPAAFDFQTADLVVTNEGWLWLGDGATASVADLFTLDDGCAVYGHGTLRLGGNGAVAFKVNGSIQAGTDGMSIIQAGSGRIDLDGDVAGDHTLNVTTSKIDGSAFAHLTIDGDALTDTFDEDVWIGANNVLTMSLDDGWTMGASSELRIFGLSDWPGPAQLNGSLLTMHGNIKVSGGPAHGQINAPIVLEPTVDATVGVDDRLEFNGLTTILGGTYVLDDGADLDFDGSTTIEGGTFATFSLSTLDGSVDFNGATTWDGHPTFTGIARQLGDADVVGPTTIDAQAFDMDGSGSSVWTISNALAINANQIDGQFGSVFDGTIDMPAALLAKLTVNLANPNDHWTMNGVMNLAGVGALTSTRVAGSPVWATGELNLTGRVAFTAPTQLLDASGISFASAASALRLSAKSFVAPNATFIGDGMLETSSTGDVTLADGASLGGVGLKNAGVAQIGSPIGAAFVDRFENTASGTLAIDLAGPQGGTTHDLLIVDNGGTTLAGSLDVNVIDVGNGFFQPHIGDSFTILAANGPINGGFANAPVSFVPGMVYLWSVTTQGSFVVLSLADSVPCAADLSGDGTVDAADLAILLGSWGPCRGCLADLNDSGAVDAADLATLLGAWGPCAY